MRSLVSRTVLEGLENEAREARKGTHYNPNGIGVQSITRIRVFDSQGVKILDQSFAPGVKPVNAHGSSDLDVVATGLVEGLQFIVNWIQAADALAPIPKVSELLFDANVLLLSVATSNCF